MHYVYASTRESRRCALAAYGITRLGLRELIDFELAGKGEPQHAWERFLNRLYHRGFEGRKLRLAVIDGNAGCRAALEVVYPNAAIQLCWAHKLRNVANCLPARMREACLCDARKIYLAGAKQQALRLYSGCAKRWEHEAPKAVRCLERDIDKLVNFLDCPAFTHKKLRTTIIIERVFR